MQTRKSPALSCRILGVPNKFLGFKMSHEEIPIVQWDVWVPGHNGRKSIKSPVQGVRLAYFTKFSQADRTVLTQISQTLLCRCYNRTDTKGAQLQWTCHVLYCGCQTHSSWWCFGRLPIVSIGPTFSPKFSASISMSLRLDLISQISDWRFCAQADSPNHC